MKNEILSNLSKVASESKSFDPSMSEDLSSLIKELTASLSDEELDSALEQTEKTACIDVEAKLINEDDIVVCVDNFPPLFKGRRYLVIDANIPGYLQVSELDGGDIGIFAINRFVLDNNEQ